MPTRLRDCQIESFIDIEGEPGSLRFRIVTKTGQKFPAINQRLREFQIDETARTRLYEVVRRSREVSA